MKTFFKKNVSLLKLNFFVGVTGVDSSYSDSGHFENWTTLWTSLVHQQGLLPPKPQFSSPPKPIINLRVFSCDAPLTVYSNITMDDGDQKFLISTFYLPLGEIFGINGILSARLLYRGNNLLMGEGAPFTPQDNCLYMVGPWYPSPANHSTAANFCCTAFE